jgi:site-specific recombinase XerD
VRFAFGTSATFDDDAVTVRLPAAVSTSPTVKEIVSVMRHAADHRHGWRVRAMIVVLWRAGLRIQEALALAEHDLDHRRGSILVRSGKGGRRRDGERGGRGEDGERASHGEPP